MRELQSGQTNREEKRRWGECPEKPGQVRHEDWNVVPWQHCNCWEPN